MAGRDWPLQNLGPENPENPSLETDSCGLTPGNADPPGRREPQSILWNCTRGKMERHDMSAFWGVVRRLLFVAILGYAFPAAISKELDSGECGEAVPEQSSVPPGPDRLDSPNHTDPESAPPTSTSASICLLVESAAQAHELPFEFFESIRARRGQKICPASPSIPNGRSANQSHRSSPPFTDHRHLAKFPAIPCKFPSREFEGGDRSDQDCVVSQPVRSLRCDFQVWENRRHSRGLAGNGVRGAKLVAVRQ